MSKYVNSELYDDNFYRKQSTGSYKSAKLILDHLMQYLHPQSVVDFGCGVGTWLKAFNESGVKRVQGYDGDWVKNENLLIPSGCFSPFDFSSYVMKSEEAFDLAISLEVAEHLPESMSDDFVSSLCGASSVIFFSAAIPFQGGKNHINEQWQSYWANKFLENGYAPFDVIRPSILGNVDIQWWYQQNAILYIKNDHDLASKLKEWKKRPEELDWVHPECYLPKCRKAFKPKLRELIKNMPGAILGDIKRNINRKLNKGNK